jgi:carboxypeptidase Q
MGCSDAHLESWGEFDMGWTQTSATLEMVKPVPGIFWRRLHRGPHPPRVQW